MFITFKLNIFYYYFSKKVSTVFLLQKKHKQELSELHSFQAKKAILSNY